MASGGSYGIWAAKADRPSRRLPYPDVKADSLRDLSLEERAKIRRTGRARVMPGNPPSWVSDEATWDRAKKAVEKYWDEYDEPWAVVTSVYRSMGGS